MINAAHLLSNLIFSTEKLHKDNVQKRFKFQKTRLTSNYIYYYIITIIRLIKLIMIIFYKKYKSKIIYFKLLNFIKYCVFILF